MDAAELRARLTDEAIDDLVERWVDDLAGRPVAELVDSGSLAAIVADGLRAAAEDDELEVHIRTRLRDAVATSIPKELVEPVRDILKGPWTSDPQLLRDLLEHRAVRNLTRDVLSDSLTRFARAFRQKVPVAGLGGRGGGRLGKLAGVATGVASAAAGVVAGEVERQIEGRVKDFMDEAIGRSLDRSVRYLSGRDAAADLGAWRAHALDVLVRRDPAAVEADLNRLEEDGLVAALADAVRAVAAWEGLAPHWEERLDHALEGLGDRTMAELLDGSAPQWRTRLAEALGRGARELVATETFAEWLEGVLGA